MGIRGGLDRTPYQDFDYPRMDPSTAGGRWETGVAAFRVEEIPLYPFCGEGEHAALVVEKAGKTTRDVALGVAERLGRKAADVGYAGMKDRDCMSVQSFTVTAVAEQAAREAFEAEGCRILAMTRHRNKLRLGHLRGNRFEALLTDIDAGAAAATLGLLSQSGVPNYFGPQRFGARGDNAREGLRALRGGLKLGRWKRDLLVSALQSFVFNEVLARRIESGALGRAVEGDLLRREDSGGLFLCEDPLSDQPRVERFEVGPTGPLPGKKMLRPALRVADAEHAVMSELGIEDRLFERETGSRRPLRVRLETWSTEPAPDGLWVRFALPAGAYATSVIRELTGGRVTRGR